MPFSIRKIILQFLLHVLICDIILRLRSTIFLSGYAFSQTLMKIYKAKRRKEGHPLRKGLGAFK